MRILFITSISLGGSGKYIEVLADGLRKCGFVCDLVYFSYGTKQDKSLEKVFQRVFYLDCEPSMSPLAIYKNICSVTSLMRNGQYDWAHSHTSLGGLYGRLGSFCSFNETKMAHTLHAFGASQFTPIVEKAIYWLIERVLDVMTDIYFCPSGYMRDYGQKTKVINASKCRIVYNSLPLPRPPYNANEICSVFRKQYDIDEEEIIFLFCGRIERQKGVDVLIRALSKIDSGLKVRLIVCGDGDEVATMQALAEEVDVASKVIWAGWQSNLEPFYCASNVYIMPSRWESFGLVFLEAMNHALPILSTSVQAIPEVVANGETGLLSQSEDYDALAKNIELLAEDGALRSKLGNAGKSRVDRIFTFQKFVDGHLAVYKSN